MRRWILPLGLWLLACGGGPTPSVETAALPAEPAYESEQEADLPVEDAWMVIVDGHQDPEAAMRRLEDLVRSGLPQVGERPRVVQSDDIMGLKPGFHIIDALTVDDEATAERVAAGLRTRWSGTYVRQVVVLGPERVRCPDDPRCLPTSEPAWRAIVIFNITDGMGSEDWAFFTDDVQRRGSAAGIHVAWGPDDGGENVTTLELASGPVEVDMEPFYGNLMGYVFAQEGREPVYQEHLPADLVLSAASAYFGQEIP